MVSDHGLIHALSSVEVLWCTLNILSIDEGKNLKASLFSVAVLDEVAGEGIDAQFHLCDSLPVRIGSQGDGANVAFLIDPSRLEWPMSKEAVGAESDATHYRPSAEL